jgi:transposase
VHLTETCDEETPHLIIHVETTAATTQDIELTETIHQHLECKDLLPAEHLMDTGYVDGEHLVTSQNRYGVELLGPVTCDPSWQGRAGEGFDLSAFHIDWDHQTVTCPQGKTSRKWTLRQDGNISQVVRAQFGKQDCLACPCRAQCTTASINPRQVTFRPRDQHEAIQAARHRQTTQPFQERYAKRAGVEGTISQGVRAFGLRRSRYRGTLKTHLQHVMTATAMDMTRLLAWIMGFPRDGTRISRFASLTL